MTIKPNKTKLRYALLYFLIFIKYLLPYLIVDGDDGLLSGFPVIYNALVTLPLMLMLAMICFEHFQWNRTDLLLILMYSTLLFSTVINHAEVMSTILHAAQVILICFTVKCVLKEETGKEVFLRLIRDVSLLFFLVDIVFAILYPDGIPSIANEDSDPFLLYGNMNTTARFLFPGLLCSILLDAKQNKRLSIATAAFFVGFVFLCIRVYYMATGLCALLFLIIWCVGRKIISKRTRLFTALVLLAFLAFELAVVVFRSKAVADFIVTLFHKSPGFTGRDALWASSINYIRKNPIIGYGVLDEATLLKMIRSPSGGHNYFLDLLFQRGIVGFIPAFIFLIFPLFRKEQNQYNSTRYILTGFALAYILMFLFEPFYNTERFHITVFYILNILPELIAPLPKAADGETLEPGPKAIDASSV